MTLLDDHRCDTVLFALPWNKAPISPTTREPLWTSLATLRSVYVGTPGGHFLLREMGREKVEVRPTEAVRSSLVGEGLMRSLPDRVRDRTLMVYGSELGAITLKRTPERHFLAPPGLDEALSAHQVRVILNPLETYVRRWQMKPKREYLSRGGRIFVSVWNRTTANESAKTWTVHSNGTERTGDVTPVRDSGLPPWVTVGVLDLQLDAAVTLSPVRAADPFEREALAERAAVRPPTVGPLT